MRYTLKDYQIDAVNRVLGNLIRARDMYRRYGDISHFSLSATTGAGKTVMAAAVIEALFFGNDEFDFQADPGAVVLWLSDDPALNVQSHNRIWSAAPDLGSRLNIVENNFSVPELRAHNVYFLNTQKLSKNSRLVRGASVDDEGALLEARPDMLQSSFFDVLTNTIENKNLTLYLILDEAHRGMKPIRDRSTIVQRLINGQGRVPAIPVVFGISATVDRFNEAMKNISNRTALPSVQVDSALVQASGLLKDDIVLSIPAEQGAFQTALLKRAVAKIRTAEEEWAKYSAEQELPTAVKPLLVVQIADKPSDEDLKLVLDTIFEAWPGLKMENVANVFGEHSTVEVGGYTVAYIEPQRVQDQQHIRVLLSKTAISTGWDCPRAEVLISFRPAKDKTHITQLLGRMIRTPLARRVSGNEVLNSVDCLLPYFDRATAESVATMLMEGATTGDDESGTGGGEGRRVLFEPVTLKRNPAVPEELWEFMGTLPSVTIPKMPAKPIKRLTALASALAKDEVRKDAETTVRKDLCQILDAAGTRYSDKVADAVDDVTTLDGEELRFRLGITHRYENTETILVDDVTPHAQSFSLKADYQAINEAYNAARRILSPALCQAYVDYLVPADQEFDEEDLIDAEIRVASYALVPEIVKFVQRESEALSTDLLTQTRVERRALTDDQQSEYDRIESMSANPERVDLYAPRTAQAETKERNADGSERVLPVNHRHILVSEDGTYPMNLNDWEQRVVETECGREHSIGWYRNPERGVKESLAIAYRDETDKWKALRPDFLFFSYGVGGSIVVDIVDPHGHHLSDALPKLRGLVDFARTFKTEVRRIESVAETNGKLRVLDITRAEVQEAILTAHSAKALFESNVASDYC